MNLQLTSRSLAVILFFIKLLKKKVCKINYSAKQDFEIYLSNSLMHTLNNTTRLKGQSEAKA